MKLKMFIAITFFAFASTDVFATITGTMASSIISSPDCSTNLVVCNSTGPTNISFGTRDPNDPNSAQGLLSVSPNTGVFSQSETGDPLIDVFVIGTLTFHNGQTLAGSEIHFVNATFTTGSSVHSTQFPGKDPVISNASLMFQIQINNTPNTNPDPFSWENADFLTLMVNGLPIPNECTINPNDATTRCTNNSFQVQEYATKSVEILGHLGSFDLIGFGNVLTLPGDTPGDVGRVNSIPEPSTFSLIGIGIALFLASNCRKVIKNTTRAIRNFECSFS